MSDFKISENKTGTLFYSRPVEAYNKPYRVRFKSFQLGLFQNRPLIEQLEQAHTNYNVFKSKRASSKRQVRASTQQPPVKVHKNMKQRSKDGEELKRRLKSMRETRRSIFDQIKRLKQ